MDPFSAPSLKRSAVARAIAHPTDDVRKVSGAILNMTVRNRFLHPEERPTAGKKTENWYSPADAVKAGVVLHLWAAGFSNSPTFQAAIDRLGLWRVTDENPTWKPGDPDPEGEPNPDRPGSPAAFVLRDFCETGGNWTLRIDVRRNALTGEYRHVAALIREDSAMGNAVTEQEGEVLLSAHLLPLTGLLAQIASHTIFKGGAHGTH
ncbi:MAG: hypothetical protein AAFU80_07585 [Pseudomonadota bacterium]